MNPQKPSIGRIVHYVERAAAGQSGICQAALITGLDEQGQATLTVFPPKGHFFTRLVREAQTNKVRDTWHWPERVE